MVVRVYKVRYELVMELNHEEAEELAEFLEDHFCVPEDSPHYYIQENFEKDFDEDDLKENARLFRLLKPLQGEEIVIA
jgi:hypothetical protein